ncbi:MAG: SLC13 family permease [Lachnospiraceae bacterium]
MSKNIKYYINSIITVLFMAAFRFIPPFGSMTELGMTILGIFLGALYGWITCDMIWPSVLALTFLGFTGYMENVAQVFTATISNPTVQLILWLLVFAALLTTTGISKQFVNRLVSSKLCKGHPWILSLFICLSVMICASFGAGFAAILICWSLVYTISSQVGYTPKDRWPKLMICSIVFFNALGALMLPFQAGVAAIFGYLANASGGTYASYDYGQYLCFSIVFVVSTTILYFFVCKVIIRPDVSKLQTGIDIGEIEPFNAKQKLAIAALLALILFTIVPSLLPAGPIKAFLLKTGTCAIVLLLISFVTFLRDKNGKPFFTFKELANGGIMWPMLFMVATATTVGGALASGDTGFTGTIMGLFSPVFESSSPYMFSVVIIIATLCLTNVINNSVASAIMVPVMFPFAQQFGVNPMMMTALICFTANCGLLLPCASPAGAMLHGNKEWVNTKEVVLHSLLFIACLLIVGSVIGIPFGNIIFK